MVHTLKITARTSGRGDFLAHCPEQYDDILNEIDGMVFTEEPDYAFFYNILTKVPICLAEHLKFEVNVDFSICFSLFKCTVFTKSRLINVLLNLFAGSFVIQDLY